MVIEFTTPEAEPAPVRTVPLDALHRSLGGRMVPFAGYELPVQYPAGIVAEHNQCRTRAALFDVSHMGQARLHGAGGAAAFETMVPGEIIGLKPGRQRYTLLLNEAGGIRDDLMVAKLSPETLFLVVNASRKDGDFAHIMENIPDGVTLEPMEDRALLALQGPLAADVLGRFCAHAATLPFMGVAETSIDGAAALISRSGYTGEDGFEISIAAGDAEKVAKLLLAEEEVAPTGLGARDSLRLEAGLCLYGNDIDELTTPVEADLMWTISKRRRAAWDFPGAIPIRDQLEHGATRRRVGLRPDGKAPARAGTTLASADGNVAGSVTSGTFSPTLGAPIAMGYVHRDFAHEGAALDFVVRGKPMPGRVAPMPFVTHRYIR